MPIPSSINDLSTTASSNSPSGGDSPGDGDDFIRALSAFVAQLRDKLNGTATGVTLDDPAFTGTASGTLTGVTLDDPAFSGTATGALTWASPQTFSSGAKVGNTARADTSTLDWYEEGTFTPTVSGSTFAGAATYSDQVGRYTRIGNRVFFSVYLHWTAHTGTGVPKVGGLPFSAASSQEAIHGTHELPTGLGKPCFGFTSSGTTTIVNISTYVAASDSYSATAVQNGSSYLTLSGSYSV